MHLSLSLSLLGVRCAIRRFLRSFHLLAVGDRSLLSVLGWLFSALYLAISRTYVLASSEKLLPVLDTKNEVPKYFLVWTAMFLFYIVLVLVLRSPTDAQNSLIAVVSDRMKPSPTLLVHVGVFVVT